MVPSYALTVLASFEFPWLLPVHQIIKTDSNGNHFYSSWNYDHEHFERYHANIATEQLRAIRWTWKFVCVVAGRGKL